MEFRIDELLDGFEDQSVPIQAVEYTSPDRIKELTMNKIKQERAGANRKSGSRRVFTIIIAAALVFALSIGAAAVYFTFCDRARQDMHIDNPTAIKEWTEYESNDKQNVNLVASFCSGEQLTAYLSVSPVTVEQAESLTWDEQFDWCATWNVRNVSPHGDGYTTLLTPIDYDAEKNTALVKLFINGSFLTDTAEMSAELLYCTRSDGTGEETSYGEFSIPVTPHDTLECEPCLDLKTELTGGTVLIDRISIGAGFITVSAELPTSLQTDNSDTDHQVEIRRSLDRAVTDFMDHAEFLLSDGSIVSFSQMKGVFTDWDTRVEGNRLSSTYLLSTPLDLMEINAFIIDGMGYSFESSQS